MDAENKAIEASDAWQHSVENIEELIHTIRDRQVLLDNDVARLYGYETKAINQAASRNAERFPSGFRFQLTEEEVVLLREKAAIDMRSQIVTASKRNAIHLPYAYTEQGIGMLSGILKNKTAIKVSVDIMNAFVEMRRFITSNHAVFARVVSVENKLLEHDHKFEEVFDLLQQPETIKQSVFFKGQFYDAFKLVTDVIKRARFSIVVIDNYPHDSILTMLSNKRKQVATTLVTANSNRFSEYSLEKFAAQYGALKVISCKDFHDRFIILDNKEVYVFGASFKDLGSKCFGVFKYVDCEELLLRIEALTSGKS